MALSEINKRILKPNWRSPEETILNGELNVIQRNIEGAEPVVIADYIKEWRNNHSLIYAGELLGAASTHSLIDDKDVQDAADFILQSGKLSHCEPLYKLAESLVNHEDSIFPKDDDNSQIPSLRDYNSQKRIEVSMRREQVRRAPYNAFRHMELARAFMQIGQNDKAFKEALIAIHLAPNNRYVTRSAVRCFLHCGDYDTAHNVLTHNEYLKVDPWLLATDISVDMIRGKTPRNVKTATRTILNDNIDPKSLTETAIALAVLENNNRGNLKKIREYVRKALISPIDNSMAQAQFLSKSNPAIDIPLLDPTKVMYGYEIETYNELFNEKYELAYHNALQWLKDSGYGRRAAVTASNIAANFLDNTQNSIAILDIALISNPKSPILLNNLAYHLLMNGDYKRAEHELSKVDYNLDIPQETRTCLEATNGLLCFKKGEYNEGEKCYMESINMARINKEKDYECIAFLNLYREKALAGIMEKEEAINSINKLGRKTNNVSVRQQILNAIKILTNNDNG